MNDYFFLCEQLTTGTFRFFVGEVKDDEGVATDTLVDIILPRLEVEKLRDGLVKELNAQKET